MKIKVGFGYDVHKLVEQRPLFLGGVEVPHTHGLLGHSDADVLIHAICDALLGAANLRDIGYHFPDNDLIYKDIDSKILLARTRDLLIENGFSIGNIDCTICAERPKLKNYIELMQQTLSGILQVDVSDVTVKATTTEKLGFVGQEKGIAAYAVCLIEKI
ncbi:MAG: 2-C-methyl-D-erythritol 2,4-cyclodiphosphate synthase [Paludibacteraceae bacterium]|nr:2-C-methyl-D-erythritol 2,4-cyclodiphosphate synthase [Paludibacteraceae bacterium]